MFRVSVQIRARPWLVLSPAERASFCGYVLTTEPHGTTLNQGFLFSYALWARNPNYLNQSLTEYGLLKTTLTTFPLGNNTPQRPGALCGRVSIIMLQKVAANVDFVAADLFLWLVQCDEY